jgi:hypothetical protein
MTRKSKKTSDPDQEVKRLLKRYQSHMPYHAVRTLFLGSIASPTTSTRPLQSLGKVWGGEMPEFASLDEANEVMNALLAGLWNRLTRHQSRTHPFRLTPLAPPVNAETIRQFAKVRVEELEAFVDGIFGQEQAVDLSERAHEALRNLGDLQSFFIAFVQFADDHYTAKSIKESVRNMQQISVIANKEINAVVLSCARARHAALATMTATDPSVH